ncbi:MAG: hypothetical protein E6Q97_10880 [Desulfurellales bacterium]|nr:MAG: hypothetical protein E6Q97_10880 [Desulfurellales bacterium]
MTRTIVTLCMVVVLTACTWTEQLVDNDARRKAKVALAAYEATQQAMLIYGHLPACDPVAGVLRFCRDAVIWSKVKAADKIAVVAINQAAPVLQGEAIDAGQIIGALTAIENVKQILQEAQANLAKGKEI